MVMKSSEPTKGERDKIEQMTARSSLKNRNSIPHNHSYPMQTAREHQLQLFAEPGACPIHLRRVQYIQQKIIVTSLSGKVAGYGEEKN